MKTMRFAFALFLTVTLVGCGGGGEEATETTEMAAQPFETSYTVEIQDGSKVFTPKKRTVTGNTGKITINNTLDAEHGFLISGLDVEEVVPANSEITVELGQVEPGEYTVDCQLHAAHKHGKLIVKAP